MRELLEIARLYDIRGYEEENDNCDEGRSRRLPFVLINSSYEVQI